MNWREKSRAVSFMNRPKTQDTSLKLSELQIQTWIIKITGQNT